MKRQGALEPELLVVKRPGFTMTPSGHKKSLAVSDQHVNGERKQAQGMLIGIGSPR